MTHTMLEGLFQCAYVTNDFEQALGLFRDRYGIRKFKLIEGVSMPKGESFIKTDTALAYVGQMMIELIHPCGGDDGFYRDLLPAGDQLSIRFHHHGHLCQDLEHWDWLQSQLTETQASVPYRGGFEGLVDFCYLDTRPSLGHYSEYVYLTREGSRFFDDVPRV